MALAVRRAFGLWGRPLRLRVDNGAPWGSWNDLPTPFALWAIGLGVEWSWNDPCRPQQNPKIERAQGTGKRWAEPHRCRTPAELQARLDEADRMHREEYRPRGRASLLELFPALVHSGRRYRESREAQEWSLERVREHLAEYVAVRLVGARGTISIYDRQHFVGVQYAEERVEVQFDPLTSSWLISSRRRGELRRVAATEITAAGIAAMNFRRPRGGRRK